MSKEASRRRFLTFLGIMAAMFVSALDQTIVGTALPRIVADLHGFDRFTWVTTVYLLTSTAMVPVVGKLSEQLGRKNIFMGGLLLFLAGSALTGTAPNMNLLIAFRGIQGIGAGVLMGCAFAIIADLFSPAERGKYTGFVTGTFGLASVIGPQIGGFLTDNWGWRWVFYVNLPFGLLVLAGLWYAFPKFPRHGAGRIDYVGAAGLALGAGALMGGISVAGTRGWSDPLSLLLIGAGAIGIAVTLAWEARVPNAVLPPSLFRNGIYSMTTLLTFLLSASMFGAITFVPLFLQGVVGASASRSGTLLTPLMISMVITSIISGFALTRFGRYKVMAVACFCGLFISMLMLSLLQPSSGEGEVVRAVIVMGIAIGPGFAIFNVIAQNSVGPRMMSSATSALQFTRQLGGALSLAIMGSLVNQRFESRVHELLPAAALQRLPGGGAGLTNPQALFSHPLGAANGQGPLAMILPLLKIALSDSLHVAFALAAVLSLVCIVLSLFLRQIPLSRHTGMARTAAEATPAGDPGPAGEVA